MTVPGRRNDVRPVNQDSGAQPAWNVGTPVGLAMTREAPLDVEPLTPAQPGDRVPGGTVFTSNPALVTEFVDPAENI
jgi:hypothetical protein